MPQYVDVCLVMNNQFRVHGIWFANYYIIKTHMGGVSCPLFPVHIPDVINLVLKAFRVLNMDKTMMREIVIIPIPYPDSVPDEETGVNFNHMIWTAIAELKALTIISEKGIAYAV